MLWLQKSRNDWLKFGDGNTKIFLTFTLIRRTRNMIEVVLDEDRRWIEEKEELIKMALKLFTELFCANPNVGGKFIQGDFPQ